MPGTMVFGFSETLAPYDSRSAIFADFDMRGSAISFCMRASISCRGLFLCFFMDLCRIHVALTFS